MTKRLNPDVARARNAVRDATADVPDGALVLVALSGGADSLALAAATGFVAERSAWRAGAVIVDHGLQADSAKVAEAAAEQARSLGLDPVSVYPAEVKQNSPSGPEGAARMARYAALTAYSLQLDAEAVLLAHTRDDQAETVLLGLARGSGARSIAGMSPVSGLWRRPFLDITREQTQAVCEASGLTWWDDPHNADDTFTRVRVRRHVMPALADALGPGVREALSRTATLMRSDAEYLEECAGRVYRDVASDDALDVAALAGLPVALRGRVIRRHAIAMGSAPAELSAVHVREVERLVTDWHGQGPLALPDVTVTRRGDSLVFRERDT